jgi:hypothetical protein
MVIYYGLKTLCWKWYVMRSLYPFIPLIILMIVALPGLAEVTIGTGTVSTGNVYTTGNIYVMSTPAGASAVLDGGVAQLLTPGTFINVPPGQHLVIVAKPGYQSYSKTLNVSVGTTENVLVTLDQVMMAGGISVAATPKGSGLYVDDIYQGPTDLVVGNLEAGPHKVTVDEPGYQASTQTVTVISGQVVPVSVTLVPENNPPTGDLQISSTPSGAVVYLDGNYKGFTPPNDKLDINDLAPGTYTLSMTKLGYQDYSTSVTLPAGKIIQVSATLVPTPTPPSAASADIVSTPSGAEIYVDNVYVGITPLSFQNVTPGSYTIELRLQGYNPFTTAGTVQAGSDVHVVAALSPIATPTPTAAPPSPFLVIMALGIVCLAGYLVYRK